jgi:SEC-C motif
MVFSKNDLTGEIIATLMNDQDSETWACSLISCDNPVCTCESIEIDLTPVQGQRQDGRILPNQRLEIDMVEKKLVVESENHMTPENLDFSNLFQSQLTDEDFEFLFQKHYAHKQKITETADMDSVDIGFDYEAVEQDGLMYAYNDVLPYGKQMQVRINDEVYLILDQYCLLPKCLCTDTTLHITPLEEIDAEDGRVYAVRLQYDKKRWEIEESPPNAVTLKTLRSVIEEQNPDFYRHLKTRHEKMKRLYLSNRQKNYNPPQVVRTTKIGRNDPCHCGSGKKYKKCCM